MADQQHRRLGTFEGVFTPTLLTILGVMMYLRTGWVVGEVGLLGAWAIIAAASLITMATALSLSSVATNVKLGAGGPYGIIARSLGLEIGGSIGIPLYLSQAVAVTMYIFGLREGWLWMFPSHPPALVDIIIFAVVVIVSMIGARVAFRTQYIIIIIIVASLISVFATGWNRQPTIEWWRGDEAWTSSHFWMVFAVFFPAVTGVTAGANMSGELARPDRAIPLGTLSAVGIATAIYLTLAYYLARSTDPAELRGNFTAMIDGAVFAPLVIAGLIGATLSSAINSFVGAPRILQALAEHQVIPLHRWLARRSRRGEPRRAMLFTAFVVAAGLLLRDLNAIAPLLTMFFLITYAGLNLVVLLEHRLAVVSFRPRLRLPQIVPAVGLTGSVVVMCVVSPFFGLLAVVAVIAVYGVLMRQRLTAPHDDVRSGAFRALAEWAARHSSRQPSAAARSWKVNLLIPVVDEDALRGDFLLVVDLTVPYGSVTLMGITNPNQRAGMTKRLNALSRDFMGLGVHATSSVIEAEQAEQGIVHAMQALRTAFLRPNILLLTPESSRDGKLRPLLDEARASEMGAMVLALHPKTALGKRKSINVWIREQSPGWDVQTGIAQTNINLLVLLSYILTERWHAELNLLTTAQPDDHVRARAYLQELVDLARLPRTTRMTLMTGSFDQAIASAPRADINLLGLPNEAELQFISRVVDQSRGTCIFVRDSGQENAFI